MVNKKLFSSLSSKNKDKVFKNTVCLALNIIDLPNGLRDQILNAIELDDMLNYRKIFDNMVKGQYIFNYKDMIFTLNVSDIKNKMLSK